MIERELGSPFEKINRISAQLGLVNSSQDWGIENADAKRYEEFLGFYYSNLKGWGYTETSIMEELIIASFNEKLVEEYSSTQSIGDFNAFLDVLIHKNHITYWSTMGLDYEQEYFPVGEVIRKYLSRPENNV